MIKPIMKIKLISHLFLTLWLLFTPVALGEYKPQKEQKIAPRSTSSGSGTTRGCEKETVAPTLLASHRYIGQTVSTHPTFAWFIPYAKPHLIEFILYEYNSKGEYQEIYTRKWQSSPGVMTFSPFAKNEVGLSIGKTYSWQIVIFCDPSSPSSALFDRAYFEVKEMSSELQRQLTNTINEVEKVKVYAEAGLWYDALEEALRLSPEKKLGEVGSNLLKDLATVENLSAYSEMNEQQSLESQQRVENWRKIADMDF